MSALDCLHNTERQAKKDHVQHLVGCEPQTFRGRITDVATVALTNKVSWFVLEASNAQ